MAAAGWQGPGYMSVREAGVAAEQTDTPSTLNSRLRVQDRIGAQIPLTRAGT